MRWRGLAGLVLIGAFASTSCGSGPPPPAPVPPAPPLELEAFISTFAESYCHRVYACCRPVEVPVVSPGTDEAGCTVEMAGFASDNARFLLGYHGIVFDPTRASSCLDTLRAGACTDIFEPGFGGLLPCQEIFLGSLGAGAECDEDHECLSTRCYSGACAASPPPVCSSTQFLDDVSDVCIQRHALGDACSLVSECGIDETCVKATCVRRLADGEPCEVAEACVGTCAPDGSGQNVCRPGVCHGP